MAAVDTDRYDCDHEGPAVHGQDGGLGIDGERQDSVHQESTGLSWNQERSLRGLHGTVLFRAYFFLSMIFLIIRFLYK